MEEKKLKNWAEFEEALSEMTCTPVWSSKFAFRGQADASLQLKPSLIRNNPPRIGLRKVENKALEYFAPRAALYHPHSSTWPLSDWLAWWPLMQHYGAPTRLLDWTTSPYVAAYFATDDCEGKDGAIYYVHFEQVNKVSEANLPLDLQFIEETWAERSKPSHLIRFFRPPRMMERMIAQQGLHSICRSPSVDHADAIEVTLQKEQKKYFGKLIIPPELKLELAWRLQYMNINAHSLFPGTDGLGKDVKRFMAHQALVDSSLHHTLRSDPILQDKVLHSLERMNNDLIKLSQQLLTVWEIIQGEVATLGSRITNLPSVFTEDEEE